MMFETNKNYTYQDIDNIVAPYADRLVCLCKKLLVPNSMIDIWDHDGGIIINGSKQWLSLECRYCQYQTSWVKINNQIRTIIIARNNKLKKLKDYVYGERDRKHQGWKCEHCGSKKVKTCHGYCSYYGDPTPTGHTCGTQSDYYNDGDFNTEKANPENIKDCDLEDEEFEPESFVDWIDKVSDIEKYDIYFRCNECDCLTGEML